VLEDGYPHEMRAADYDDWCTPTIEKNRSFLYSFDLSYTRGVDQHR
jgi:asparagine synthetase A